MELSNKGELNDKSKLKSENCNGLDDIEGATHYETIHLVTCKDGMVESFEGEVR